MAVSEAALQWAEQTRADREDFLAKCVGLGLAAVRAEVVAGGARLGDLRLLPVLEAIPQVGGKVASRRLMASAGLAEDVVLGDVDDATWDRLIGEEVPA